MNTLCVFTLFKLDFFQKKRGMANYSYVFSNTNQACSDNLGTDDIDNFMDYTGTYTTFTYDQRERIQHVFENGVWFNELKNSNQ